MTVAVLFVQPRGVYSTLDGVELWDEQRDARKYDGPHPVVAHPPCSRWCQLARLNERRYGHRVGDDGGCFSSALDNVRAFGGVLEHPAESLAWPAHLLPPPNRRGGWSRSICGGWVCHVEQGNYGHEARKATWLYAYGVDLPQLKWGKCTTATAFVSWADQTNYPDRKRISKDRASATPMEFARLLISIADSARREVAA